MTEQTTHHLAESISALVDSQASELELQRILKASQSDPEVKMTWARYQVASAVIRHDMPAFELTDFSARVSAALEAEETYNVSSVNPVKPTQWWQHIGRFAVAASVAGGVIMFSQNFNSDNNSAAVMAAATLEAPVAAPAVSIPSGYHGQGYYDQTLSLRTVGLQNGYEARQQDNRQVVIVPHQATNDTSPAVSNEEVRDYLNKLIEAHADNAALNSSQGMLPFARVVLTEED